MSNRCLPWVRTRTTAKTDEDATYFHVHEGRLYEQRAGLQCSDPGKRLALTGIWHQAAPDFPTLVGEIPP